MTAYRLPMLHLLWWAVWAEFLLVRLFSRIGIYIPKGGAVLKAYKGAILTGEIAFNFSLSLGAVLLGMALLPQRRWPAVLAGVAGAVVLFAPGAPPPALWSLLVALAAIGAVGTLGMLALRLASDRWERAGLGLVLAAHVVGYGVGAWQLAWVVLALPGEAPLAGELLRAGELAAVLAPLVLVIQLVVRTARSRLRVGAGLGAASVLGIGYWANADMTAILAMYSLGFSLSWPAVLYLCALAAGVYALTEAIRVRPERGLALGLIFLSGYSLVSNQQHILVLTGWAILALEAQVEKEAAA